MFDDGGEGSRPVRGDVVGDRLQLREGGLRYRLGEDVDDPATGEADGKRVVVADAVSL